MKRNPVTVITVSILGLLLTAGCRTNNGNMTSIDRKPVIEPDYSGVTIPPNIAPMNFIIKEEGKYFIVEASSVNGYSKTVRSRNGVIRFSRGSWKKLLSESIGDSISINVISEDSKGTLGKYNTFSLFVAKEPVDPWISYRLLYPGYESYKQIVIRQRNIESFRENSVVENQLLKTNCVNCHSFCNNDPDKMLIHVRGSVGGTYFYDGKKVTRMDLKADGMKFGAVYPAWHPGGKFVAFSSNSIVQSFHASQEYNVEVTDLESSLVVYNTDTNIMMPVDGSDTISYMETFPEWSPDGKYLYYCRAVETKDTSDFKRIKYDLVRKAFDEVSTGFGKAELIFDARSVDKSVSFPRVSPDGKYLIFTLHNNGNFSIWHKEADLYLIDLQTGKTEKMSVNSDETESWHSWSSNGRWLMFSSKRGDGLTARPYFAYFGPDGQMGRPFVLPQKDPDLYRRMIKTFNRPEFMTGRIKAGPRDFGRASGTEALKARWGGAKVSSADK